MKTFKVRFLLGHGFEISGRVEAASEAEAQLKAQAIIALDVRLWLDAIRDMIVEEVAA
jgi:hypothetical protein